MNHLMRTLHLENPCAVLVLMGVLALAAPTCKSQTAPSVKVERYLPPPNSPLARKVHPRLFFAPEDLPKLRQRLQTLYPAEFQRFVTALDKCFEELPENKDRSLEYFDTKNFAFLYLIDPGQMRGIQFGHTREDYGRKARELAMYLKRETRGDRHSSANLQSERGGYHNLALAVAYDWLYPLLTLEDRRALADAMIRLYENRDKDANIGEYEKLSNQVTGYIHAGTAAALATWGDDLGPNYSAKAQEMLDFFNAVFLQRILETADKVFEGPGWSEGCNYYRLGLTNISFLAGAASSALGRNLFYEYDLLRYNIIHLYYNILPLKLRDNYYFSRHDTNSLNEVIGYEVSRLMQISAGALRQADPRMAGFAQWLITASGLGLAVEEYKHFNPRFDDLFFSFIWGSKEVPALAPEAVNLPLTYKLGLGQVVMKSSFDKDNSTHLIFWAPKYWYSPHAHHDQSSFTIFKYGSLALDAGNSKNADDMPRGNSSREAVFHNILGLYDPKEPEEVGDPNFMEFTFSSAKRTDYWKDAGFQPGGGNHIGDVRALESGEDFDYVDYDYTRAYKGERSSKATAAHRRFVYLRGPENREFVLIHDLVESPLEKRWLLHTAFEPEIQGDQISVTNTFDAAHGRMLVKSLLPAKKEVLKVGGEGQWFVDAEWKFIKARGPYTDWGAYWTGSWRAEIRAQDGEFLTVMQIGDARTLQAMAPVVKIESASHTGALIDNKRLVLFSKKTGAPNGAEYQISASQTVSHLIGGLPPNAFVKIKKNGKMHLNMKTGAQGVLFFQDNPGGSVKYEIGL
ncbi:MAG: hypothetical protein ACREOO_18030 [bacterium]